MERFIRLGEMLADLMPWILEHLVKQHTSMMCPTGRYGRHGGMPA
jgi:hypothetical protein